MTGPIGGAQPRPDFDLGDADPVGQDAQGTEPAAGATAPAISRLPASRRSPEATVRAFYESFTHLRYDEVAQIYAPDLKYKDPLFEHKDAGSTIHMWKTLFQADNLRLGYEVTGVEGDVVKGRWTADYDFHGRPVHEVSESRFVVKNGRIVSHQDDFSVVAWARQALPLGPLERFADTTLGRAVITRLMRFGIKLAEKGKRDDG